MFKECAVIILVHRFFNVWKIMPYCYHAGCFSYICMNVGWNNGTIFCRGSHDDIGVVAHQSNILTCKSDNVSVYFPLLSTKALSSPCDHLRDNPLDAAFIKPFCNFTYHAYHSFRSDGVYLKISPDLVILQDGFLYQSDCDTN